MADEVKIDVTQNGPYVVHGPVTIKDADGNAYSAKDPCALCRCGHSSHKPFCDGTHAKVGFKADERAPKK